MTSSNASLHLEEHEHSTTSQKDSSQTTNDLYEKVRICNKVDIQEVDALILSQHSDIAFKICEKYKTRYDCWNYDSSARRLVVDLGALEAWDYGVQDEQALVVFQHVHLGLVDELVIHTYIERSYRHGLGGLNKISYDDVVTLDHYRDLLALIDFSKVKSIVYTNSPPWDFPTGLDYIKDIWY